jgi:hypothetical protein
VGAGDVFPAGEGVRVVSCAGVGLFVLGPTGSDVTQDESRVAEPGINFCPLPHSATENTEHGAASSPSENEPLGHSKHLLSVMWVPLSIPFPFGQLATLYALHPVLSSVAEYVPLHDSQLESKVVDPAT